jgi:DNA-binding transcriptional LysR family regulator
MSDPLSQFNWDDLKFFIELVRSGSPSAAGRKLRADHTTVRRRVLALEDALQARLFSTRGQNYGLTVEGDRLLHYAEAIEGLATRAREDVSKSDTAVAGTVRVGAPDGFGSHFLSSRMPALAALHPQLKIQLIMLPRHMNLTNREADMAIALETPNQHRQIIRKLTDYKLYIYGSESYLEGHAPIVGRDDLKNHPFVGYVPDLIYSPKLDYLAELDPAFVAAFESTNVISQMQAIKSGAGLGILPSFLAATEPSLRPVLADDFSIDRQFWLVIHPEAINLTRVRTVIDFVAESVRRERRLFRQPYWDQATASDEEREPAVTADL